MVKRRQLRIFVLSLFLFFVPWASADTQFRLIVDASGSMLISDPDKLTAESLKLISDLAPEQKATLGVWLFGERARVLLPESMISSSTKSKLDDAIKSYTPGDLKTDLESIVRLLIQTPDSGDLAPGFDRHWILVTDGMVDVSLDDAVNQASRNRITDELATQLAERGVHLHTVSMTGYTDKELLQSISTLTDATHTEVATPDELLDTFDRIFSQASPSEEVPFEGNTFFIDDAIDEATLLIFHEQGVTPKIHQPNGKELSLSALNVSAVQADHYLLATVTKPMVGTWQVEDVDLERSNIRVITKLSAQATKVAPVLFVNEPIYSTVGLFQDDQLIDDPEVLDLIEVHQSLNLLNGETTKQLLKRPLLTANYQFKNKIDQITDSGNYELISEVDGKTFVRKLSQFFSVAVPIELEASKQSENLISFSAKPTNLRLNMLRSNAKLILTSNDGSEESLEMPLIGEGFWQKIYPVSPNTTLSAHVRLIGITQQGVRFEYSTPDWYLTRDGAGDVSLSQLKQEPETALATAAAVNRDLVPLVITPQVAVVATDEVDMPADNENTDEANDKEADASQIADDTAVDNEEEAPAGLSKTDWLLYGSLNGAGLLVLIGGYWLFRRVRKKRKQIDIEDK
ncbi:VWA domain-containing protein [Marinomonas ostreistagni]|uniref:VWA domain-containing protein n=1 Tax=Marinomonas ostreistagni TaxID=359209 RepID=A0ABS0ZFR9_9GAMM|nr:VWA domain-containing protein [Marinomonas ostreistagni]MBJ7552506.1 VWA domain-containing protein [Marinomonas ostreistagni]